MTDRGDRARREWGKIARGEVERESEREREASEGGT